MSGYEVMVQRITTIIAELYQYGSVSRQRLRERFNVSERTLYRDLNRLGDRIIHDGKGIYHLAPAYAKSQSLKDLQDLARALGVAELVPVNKLALRPGAIKLPETLTIRSLPVDAAAQQALNHNFTLIDKAIREGRLCGFHYKNSARVVEPYKLLNLKGVWYLGAVEKGDVKGYQLSKISWLTLNDSHFSPNPHIQDYFDKEDDVWFSLNKQTVEIRVSHEVSYYFSRRNVLPAQSILRKEKNGDLIVKTDMAHENQLFPLLRYWLPHLVILHPADLQARFYQQLNQHISVLQARSEHA